MYPIFIFFVFYFLFQVLRRTVFDGESQSALLLGGTGSGKSLLLDRVLRSLAHEAADRGGSASGLSSGLSPGLSSGLSSGSGLGEKRKRWGGGECDGVEEGQGGDGSAVSPPCSEGATGTEKEQASPLTPPPPPFRVVYLNGLAQTDDAVAMKEVVQQLGVTGTQGAAYSR